MSRTRRPGAALLGVLLLVAGCAGAPPRPVSAGAPPADAPTRAASTLVAGLSSALAAGRVPGADVVAPGLADRLRSMVAAMRSLRVRDLALRLDPATVSVRGEELHAAAVGSARIEGAWPGGAPQLVRLQARRQGSRWVLTELGDASTPAQPWDLPGARRLDVGGVVTVGDAPEPLLRWYATEAAAAWAAVARAWPDRPAGAPVVVVPRTGRELASQLGVPEASLASVAAMTSGSLQRGRVALGDRVVVNPAVQERLTEEGRRTILRHELTHVAVRGTTAGTVPQWLTEGYATQASWVDGVPRQLRARARGWDAARVAPRDVPSDAAVERSDVAYAYDASAVLVDDLVARHGRPAVVAFYRAMAGGSSREQAARSSLGEGFDEVLGHWRAAMARVAGR